MLGSSVKARASVLVAAAVGAVGLAVVPAAHGSQTAVKFVRLGGVDRYQTAQILAEHAFPAGVGAVLLARAQDFAGGAKGFADALAANYIAGYLGTPILLTDGSTLSPSTLQALKDLKVKNVGVMGGSSAIGQSVLSQLGTLTSTSPAGGTLVVSRAAGLDRYQTAALADELVPASFVGKIGGVPTALIARGDDFPDALAGGPLAYNAHLPLILTPPSSLDPSAAQALTALGIKKALILGGTAAVSGATEQAIQALGITTQRLAGANRQQTATAIAGYAIANLGFKGGIVDLARGDNYPDALAGGPEAAVAGPAPIILTASTTELGPESAAFLTADKNLQEVDILGGKAAIADSVLSELEALLGGSPTTTTTTGAIPGLNVPGLGALLSELTPPQLQSLLPILTALPSPVLTLVGQLIQAVPNGSLSGLGSLLGQPTSVLGPLATLAPGLPSGGLGSLGSVLSSLSPSQLGSVAGLLSGLPAGAASPLGSLLSTAPAGQLPLLGSLLGAASPAQLGDIGQVLTIISTGTGVLNLPGLLALLSGLPGSSVLNSLSQPNAASLSSVLGVLSTGQVTQLGGVLSTLPPSAAGPLGSLLSGLPSGGVGQLGSVLSAVPTGQGGAIGGVLTGLTPQGGTALAALLASTPLSSLPLVGQLLTALP